MEERFSQTTICCEDRNLGRKNGAIWESWVMDDLAEWHGKEKTLRSDESPCVFHFRLQVHVFRDIQRLTKDTREIYVMPHLPCTFTTRAHNTHTRPGRL